MEARVLLSRVILVEGKGPDRDIMALILLSLYVLSWVAEVSDGHGDIAW